MQTNDHTDDPVTLETLQRMSPEELSSTMRSAVKDAQTLAPSIADEERRAALEAETGRIRQLFAQTIPEFRSAIDQRDRSDGLEPIVRSRGSADETREKIISATADKAQRDEGDLDALQYGDGPIVSGDPAKTLYQADEQIVGAYALRGMNGARALARIKRGIEATPETRNHWFDAEIAERMAAGDLPRGVAEKEIAELHTHAARTYRASERAIQRGVSLDATEVHAPEDPAIVRRREERDRFGNGTGDRTLGHDRDRDARTDELESLPLEPPSVDRDDTPNERKEDQPTTEVDPSKDDRASSREPDKTPNKRLTEEELRQLLTTRERELTEAQKQRDSERGIERNNSQDRGLGLAD